MIAQVEQKDGTYVDDDLLPCCGDECAECGACLKCYGEDRCPVRGDLKHVWVKKCK